MVNHGYNVKIDTSWCPPVMFALRSHIYLSCQGVGCQIIMHGFGVKIR